MCLKADLLLQLLLNAGWLPIAAVQPKVCHSQNSRWRQAICFWQAGQQHSAFVFAQAEMATVAEGFVPGDMPCFPGAVHLQVHLKTSCFVFLGP